MGFIQSLIAFLGRAFLGIIFIAFGINHLLDWPGAEAQFTQTLNDWLAQSVGNPSLQRILEWALNQIFISLALATGCAIAGGLFLFLGFWVRVGAFLLILVMLPFTFLFHHFWDLQGLEKELQLTNFLKNVGLMGGLLGLLAYGRGGSRKERPAQTEK